jgi:hypothetical protein
MVGSGFGYAKKERGTMPFLWQSMSWCICGPDDTDDFAAFPVVSDEYTEFKVVQFRLEFLVKP